MTAFSCESEWQWSDLGPSKPWSQCGWCRADLIWKQNIKIIGNSCALPVRPNLSPISNVECYESFNKIRSVNVANCLILAFYHFKHFWLISTAQVIECGRPPPAPGQAAGAGDLSFFPFFLFSSVRSSYSHPDLIVIHHPPPTFSDHTGPQHWTFTFWATTAI